MGPFYYITRLSFYYIIPRRTYNIFNLFSRKNIKFSYPWYLLIRKCYPPLFPPPRKEKALILNYIQRDMSGTMGFSEFKELWSVLNGWRQHFISFDSDKSGTVDPQELQKALTTMGGYGQLFIGRSNF